VGAGSVGVGVTGGIGVVCVGGGVSVVGTSCSSAGAVGVVSAGVSLSCGCVSVVLVRSSPPPTLPPKTSSLAVSANAPMTNASSPVTTATFDERRRHHGSRSCCQIPYGSGRAGSGAGGGTCPGPASGRVRRTSRIDVTRSTGLRSVSETIATMTGVIAAPRMAPPFHSLWTTMAAATEAAEAMTSVWSDSPPCCCLGVDTRFQGTSPGMDDGVCIVGAGGSGLAAAYALQRRAIPFRVFEARDDIGGMWRQGPESFAYDSLESNTSRWRSGFRAMRMPVRADHFLHHTEMLAYLEAFADRFNLRPAIETGARVERAVPDGDGWLVTVAGREPERFRAVVAATGVLTTPRRAVWPGTFDGPRLHTGEYRSPHPFAGKDVVIAGIGTSAGEIAAELVDHARSVTVAGSTGQHVITKHLLPGLPYDLLDTRSGARLYPFWLRRRVLRGLMTLTAGPPGAYGLPKPDHRVLDRPTLGSDGFVRVLRRGQVEVRPRIVRLDGDTVHFEDGTSRRADALIEGTGYDTRYDYLPPELVAGFGELFAPVYRGVLHPRAPGLYFMTLAVGAGALLPLAEAQAHWAAAHIAGELRLRRDVDTLMRRQARTLRRQFGRPYPVWRDRQAYVIELEREVRARASPARAW
jgi:dimethylaniline monooxygenase (N-oxide forming)